MFTLGLLHPLPADGLVQRRELAVSAKSCRKRWQ